MKKKLLLQMLGAVLLSFLTISSMGQMYLSTLSTDAGSPGGLNTEANATTTGWTEILGSSIATNQWTSPQAIPFTFNVYGSPVTHFVASGNGLVTFDTTVAAGTPPNANMALPDAGLPDNTVACFWDEFTGSAPTGSNDRVYMKVFGTAPNRQLWIKWFSYEWGPSADFNYVAVVLEETSDKIYIADLYSSSNLTSATTTVGVQVNGTTAFTDGNSIGMAGNGSGNTDDDYYEYTFFMAGACLPPSNGSVANITSSSADISWTSGGATAWQLEYGTTGFSNGSGTLAGTTSNPNTLTGLSPNTTYDVYIRDSCGAANVSSWAGPVTFTTLCASQLSGTYTINSGAATGGTNFNSFADVMSELNDCGVSGPVTFNVMAGTYNENLTLIDIVGSSMSNPIVFDGGSAANVTLTYSSSDDTATVYLNGADYVTIQNMTIENTSSSDGWGIMLQNASNHVTINQCNIVMPVTTTTDIIGIVASAALSFETSTGDNANNLTISNCSFHGGETGIHLTGGSSSAAANTGNSIMNNIFRMQDDHAIEVDGQVNLMISGNDIDSLNSTFATAMYLQDIDDYQVLNNRVITTDWGIYIIDGNDGTGTTNRSLVANNMVVSSADYAMYLNDFEETDVYHNSLLGEPALRMNDQVNTNIRNNIMVSSGDFALESDDDLTAGDVVDYNIYNSGGSDAFDIGTSVYTDLSAWQTGDAALNVNSQEGDPVFIGPEDLHLAGTLADNTGTPVGVTDDIDGDLRSATTPDIGADEYMAPSCAPSSGLAATNISSSGAQLSWVAGGGTSFNIEYGPAGFSIGNGTVVSGVSNPHTLTGLSALTAYEFYVQDDCGAGGTSPWSGPVSFTTLCSSVAVFPWVEDFETSQSSIPACWENETGDDEDWIFRSGSIGHGATTDNTTGTSSGYYAGVDDSQSSANDTVNNLLSPSFDLSGLVTPRLGFFYFIGNDNTLTSTLYIDVYDGTTWNMGVDVINFSQAAWLEHFVDLTPYKATNSRIRFRAHETTDFNSDISIDDITVEETPSCIAPSALGVASVTDVTADIYWTVGSASNWDVSYGVTGTAASAGTIINALNDSITLSGLSPATVYDFYVRDSCGPGDVSVWVGPFTFNTAPCPVADQCAYSVDLFDSFGDGWNGAEISLVQSGVSLGTFGAGFTTGSTFGPVSVDLCDSITVYAIAVSPGGFPTEVSFDITDPFGTQAASVASGSSFSAGDTLATFLAVCTAPACADPVSLGVTNIEDISADVYWTEFGTATAWEVEYGSTGFTQGMGNTINASNDTTGISTLTAATSYDFYVRADCGGGLFSAWVGPFTFTTAPCAAADQCAYSVDLFDSFGDGWNGAEISLVQSGVSLGTFGSGFTTGSTFGPVSVDLCDSITVYAIAVSPGGFPTEVSFDITDPFGTQAASVASGSSFSAGDTLATFLAVCTAPACADPISLGVTSIEDVSTDLYWTEVLSSTTSWEVEFGPTGFVQGTGTVVAATNDTVTAGALTASTSYDFYVRADCGGGLFSAWVGPFTWTTAPCASADQCAYSIDLFDTFGDGWNGAEVSLVQAGSSVGTFGANFTTGTTFGPVSIDLCDSIMTYAIAVSPGGFPTEVFFDINNPFGVQVASFASGSSFAAGDTLATFLAVCTPPSCADPTALGAINVAANTADLFWNDFGTAVDWSVEYGPAGFVQGTGTGMLSTNDTLGISGLMPNTMYDFYVRANCGGPTSAWVGPFTFVTQCASFTAPYTYDFEVATVGHWDGVDNCWTIVSNNPGTTSSGGYSWEFRNTAQTTSGTGTGPDRDNTLAPATGGIFATADVSGSATGTDSTMLISPLIDVSGLTTPELRFYYHKWGSNMPDLHVDLWDGSWTNNYIVIPGVTNTSPADPYILGKAVLSGLTGSDIQIRFRIISQGCCQGDIGLDDFSILEAPLCPDPTFLSLNSVTSNSAVVSFSASGSTFNYEVGPTGFTQGTGTIGSGGNPLSISGLNPNTTYDVYVQSDCSGSGNGTSVWVGPLTFTTACVPVTAPWSESFDGTTWVSTTNFNGAGDTIDNCWNRNPAPNLYSWTVRGPGTVSFTTGPAGDNSGTGKYMMLEGSNGSAGNTAELYTPLIDVSSLARPELRFYFHTNVNPGDSIIVDVQDSSGTWNNHVVALGQFQTAQSDPYEYAKVDLGPYGDTVQVRFRSVKSTAFNGDMAIDDVSVNNAPLCPEPTFVNSGIITNTTAEIMFTSTGSTFNFEWGPTGFVQGTGSTGTGGNPYTITGLNPATTYDVYIQNDCSGAGNGTSIWVGPYTFSTKVCDTSAACDYTVDLFDSFGDGWNGAIITFRQNGIDVGTLGQSFTTGTQLLSLTMSLCDSMPTEVVLTSPGSFSNEIGFDITTPYGAPAASFQSSANIAAGTVLATFTTQCTPPACPDPFNVNITGVTSSAVFFGFSTGGTGGTFNFEVGPTGFTQGTGTVSSGGNPGTVSGLMPNTTYDLYIQNDCSGSGNGTSAWVGPFTFTTLCAPFVAPYFEDFETSFNVGFFDGIENCVTIESDNPGATPSGGYSWEVRNTAQTTSGTGTGPDRDNTLAPAIGGHFVTADVSGSAVGEETRLLTPLVDITGLTSPELEYYYHMHGTNMADLHVDIWDGSAWINDAHLITGTQNTSQSDPYNDTTLDLSTYNIDTIQVRFRVTSDGCCSGDVAIDDIRISDPPTCPAPSNLGVFNETTTSADVYWTSGGASHAIVEYGPAGFAVGTGTRVTTTNDTLSLTGLTVATLYEFYVQDSCGANGLSFQRGPFTFYTSACDTADRCNYIVDLFDTFGDGWNGAEITFYQNGIPVATIGSGFTTGTSFGPVSVSLCDSLPTVVRITQLGGFPNEVGFDVYDPFGTTLVGQHTATFGLATNDSLTSFMTNCTPPSCPPPSNFTLLSTQATTASISWTPGGVGTDYNIEYGPVGFTPGNGTQVSTTTIPYMITGLTPASCYDIYVRDSCGLGDVSNWVGPITMCTECLSYMAPYSYDFEGGTVGHFDGVDSCWTIISNNPGTTSSGGYSWEFRNTPQTTSGTTTGPDKDNTLAPATGGVFVTADVSGSATGDSTMLLSPLVDLSAISSPQLEYHFHMFGTQMADLHVDINAGSGWDRDVNLLTGQFNTSQSDPYNDTLVDLSAYSGQTIQVRFRAVSNGCCAGDIALDDISILGAPSACAAPTNLAATNISCTGADLSWMSASTTIFSIVEYGLAGFTPGSGTLLNPASNPVTLSGLQPGTNYAYYVVDICSSDTSTVAGPFAFTTASGPLNADFSATSGSGPLEIDFDASASIGGSTYSWTFGDGNNGSGMTTSHTYASTGTYYVSLTITGPCGSDTFSDSVNVTIGLEDNVINQSLSIYPNPTEGQVHISFETSSSEGAIITIMDLTGKTVIRSKASDLNGRFDDYLDISKLAKGTYMLRIESGSMQAIRRIVKQ